MFVNGAASVRRSKADVRVGALDPAVDPRDSALERVGRRLEANGLAFQTSGVSGDRAIGRGEIVESGAPRPRRCVRELNRPNGEVLPASAAIPLERWLSGARDRLPVDFHGTPPRTPAAYHGPSPLSA